MTRVGIIRLVVIVGFLGFVETATRLGWIDSYSLIPPSQMAVAAWDILRSGRMNADILLTLQNVGISFVLAVIVGFAIGVVLSRMKRLRRAVNPYLASYYAVPVFIFYPLMIALFGLNAWPLIAIGFLFAIAAMIVNTLDGFDRIPKVFFKTARVTHLSRTDEILRIILPGAAPYLFNGVKLSLAYSFIGVIAGEFILSGAGLGYEIAFAYNNFDNRTMYGLMLLLIAFVTTINMSLHVWDQRIARRRGGR
jgi:NitT/TauT family transport system permease protein